MPQKNRAYDVLCEDKNGVKIIVEMQVAPNKGFEKRAQYYAAKAYSRQLNKGQDEDGKYHNLKEVIFIAISNYVIFKDKEAYKSNHVILDKKTYEHDLKYFSFTFIELPKFKKDNISELNNILEKWCYFFKHADETSEEDLKKIIGSDLVIEKAYDALNQFNWSEDELFFYEEEIKRIRDNIAAMDFQFDKGFEKGIEQGIEKGVEKVAIKMLKKNKPIEEIIEFTGLSLQQIKNLESK